MSSFHFRLGLLVLLVSRLGGANGKCPKKQISVQDTNKNVEFTGCMKPPPLMGRDIPGDEDFTYCCQLQSLCRSTCGLSQDYCDNDFKKCMLKLCKTNFRHNLQCKEAADVYYMGSSIFGEKVYDDAQALHCTCMGKSEVSKHYLGVFDNIYSTSSGLPLGTQDAKMERLRAKYTSASSAKGMRKVYFQLQKRYSSVIKPSSSSAASDGSIDFEGVELTPPKPTKEDL